MANIFKTVACKSRLTKCRHLPERCKCYLNRICLFLNFISLTLEANVATDLLLKATLGMEDLSRGLLPYRKGSGGTPEVLVFSITRRGGRRGASLSARQNCRIRAAEEEPTPSVLADLFWTATEGEIKVKLRKKSKS